MDKIKFKKIQVMIKTQQFSIGSYGWQSCLRGEHISNSNVFCEHTHLLMDKNIFNPKVKTLPKILLVVILIYHARLLYARGYTMLWYDHPS